MTDLLPFAITCYECGTVTFTAADVSRDPLPCENCDQEGRDDPYCVEYSRVTPCRFSSDCPSSFHHPRFGAHLVELDETDDAPPPAPLPRVEVTISEIEDAIGRKLQTWRHDCHGVSIAIVRSGVLGVPCRVARGWAAGVGSQHSWVIVGDDAYDPQAQIIDVTLWSYDPSKPPFWTGSYEDGIHRPHGYGSIWETGKPTPTSGEFVNVIPPAGGWSADASLFLQMLGPLDRQGWHRLLEGGMRDWPAREIVTQMERTPDLTALVPIDILGMVTDLNPGGLYLAGEEVLA